MNTLTEDDVRRLLDPARVIGAIENAFRDLYPSTVVPARTHINLDGGIFLAMPCYDGNGHILGTEAGCSAGQSRMARGPSPGHLHAS